MILIKNYDYLYDVFTANQLMRHYLLIVENIVGSIFCFLFRNIPVP